VVEGRSSSNTFARDRPAPSTPCNCPPAPRDSRIQNQPKIRNGSRMMIQVTSWVPNPGDGADEVTCTPPASRSLSSACPACGGMTTV